MVSGRFLLQIFPEYPSFSLLVPSFFQDFFPRRCIFCSCVLFHPLLNPPSSSIMPAARLPLNPIFVYMHNKPTFILWYFFVQTPKIPFRKPNRLDLQKQFVV